MSRRFKNCPQCHSVKGVGAAKKVGKWIEKAKKGFLGMRFTPSRGARSSSTIVFEKDWDKGKPDWDGDFNDPWNSPPEKVQDRALMDQE